MFGNNVFSYIMIAVSGAVVIVCIASLIVLKKQKSNLDKNDKIRPREADEDIVFKKNDILLAKGKTYTVDNENITEGSYTLISHSEAIQSFYLRVGGLVREFKQGEKIVLAEGEQICAVSNSIILR